MHRLQRFGKPTLAFLLVVLVTPLMVELFGGTGRILLGTLVDAHPWLFTVFAYLPILLLLFVYLFASLEPFATFGLRARPELVGWSAGIGVVSAVVLFLIDRSTGAFAAFGITPSPGFTVGLGWIVVLGLLVPFTEELLFRGVIQSVFMDRWSSAWKVHPAVFVAVGFELVFHLSVPLYSAPQGMLWSAFLTTLPQLGYVLVFGVLGGIVYARTRSLLGPFLIHALGNAGELLLFWAFG